MKETCKKISAKLRIVFGWGILLCLFAGGLTFFGYLAALIVGGEAAALICTFIYKQFANLQMPTMRGKHKGSYSILVLYIYFCIGIQKFYTN